MRGRNDSEQQDCMSVSFKEEKSRSIFRKLVNQRLRTKCRPPFKYNRHLSPGLQETCIDQIKLLEGSVYVIQQNKQFFVILLNTQRKGTYRVLLCIWFIVGYS